MSILSRTDIALLVKENDVQFIRLQFTDLFGQLKNVAITLSQLEKCLDNKCMIDGLFPIRLVIHTFLLR